MTSGAGAGLNWRERLLAEQVPDEVQNLKATTATYRFCHYRQASSTVLLVTIRFKSFVFKESDTRLYAEVREIY